MTVYAELNSRLVVYNEQLSLENYNSAFQLTKKVIQKIDRFINTQTN